MQEEHSFAQYVRILGKGKKGSRGLSQAEAQTAMTMILDNKVEPEQLGAFLMLLRVKEETPEELAGFVAAVHQHYVAPKHLQVDLDWSSYAGKRRQLPWFLLAALCLASHGYSIFMHGATGHTDERIYIEQLLADFDLNACLDWHDAEENLANKNFAFMPIQQLCPVLNKMIQLRSILGLRTPVNTLARMLNPLSAPASIDGVFHTPYGPMHQKTAELIGYGNNLTVQGEGGEAEAKPDSHNKVQWLFEGQLETEDWPAIVKKKFMRDLSLNPSDLAKVWCSEIEHEYGVLAIQSTLALVLKLLGQGDEQAELLQKAEQLWKSRNIELFKAS